MDKLLSEEGRKLIDNHSITVNKYYLVKSIFMYCLGTVYQSFKNYYLDYGGFEQQISALGNHNLSKSNQKLPPSQ